MLFPRVILLMLIVISFCFGSPTINSHLIMVPSAQISYEFGRSSGFGIGGNVGIFHMSHSLISGFNLGAHYNFTQKSLGFNQTLTVGNIFLGAKLGGKLSRNQYRPQIGLYTGYVFGYLDYDYTLFDGTFKVSTSGLIPIYLKGLETEYLW